MISIQTQDFKLAEEYDSLRDRAGDVGAIVTFTGLVREIYQANEESGENISSLYLEHYPGMTEKSLEQIVDQASEKWPLLATRVIHRVGELRPSEQIVFVGTASAHRQDAFDAAQYIMDYLKSKAPFWKKQNTTVDAHWVESRQSDEDALQRWKNS